MYTRQFILAVCCALFTTTGHESRAQVTRPTNAASTPSPLAGFYELVSIDGHLIPFAALDPDRPPNAPPPPEVIASSFIVKPDGSFLMAIGFRNTVGTVQHFLVRPMSGSCAPEGDGFVARWDGAGRTPITLVGDTLTVNNLGMLFAYRKVR